MKILMIGLGSIGQRHVRNIRRIYGDSVEIIAYRVRRLQQTFSDAMKIRDGVNLEEEYHIKSYSDLEEALAQKPDIAFITNITSKHIEMAISCAKAGCDIFLEKPVSDSLERVEEFQKIVEEKKLIVFMGYQNRYHVCIKKLREYLKENNIGKIVSVDTVFGERLTTMHSYEDYSTTYMARKEMGGGPVLNLQIHDIDLLIWLFGMPELSSVKANIAKYSDLKIDVEDHAVITYTAKYQKDCLTVTTKSDFISYPPVHSIKLTAEKARIDIDMNKAQIIIYEGDAEPLIMEYPDFQRNDMFIEELKDFMKSVKERSKPEISLDDGIKALKLAVEAKKQMQ